ncbi:conserved hypothetical protein [Burkholderia gladioli]|uniref:hypothetical protein n=1 Tax=Burkholderia gladioli TaxID=28095 RepID=UPI001CB007AA|nr:hypothetical protein [Burkholderia gladioli]CAG9205506.1 conserved hypothetical protein [Burkholderia gladioli]
MTTTNESSTDNRFYREPSALLADGGPAFPITDGQRAHDIAAAAIIGITDSVQRERLYTEARAAVVRGMSLRAYAAIKLRVPDSGIDWLDQMIVTSMRDEFAAKAMHAALITSESGNKVTHQQLFEIIAPLAYQMADSMLKARG